MFGATRSRLRRVRHGVTAVAVGLVLLGASACSSGDQQGDDADGKNTGARNGGATGKPSAAGPAPLTKEQLTAASLTDGEKIGRYTVSDYALGAPLGEDYTAEPAVCQPLVSLAPGATAFDPAAEVHRKADVPDEMLGLTVSVQLRSYAAQGATGVLKALRTAGKECAGGFTEDRALARAKYLRVEPAEAPGLGDEATAYRFTILDVKGTLKLYEYLTVVRSGSTTLSFRAEIPGTEDVGGVPDEIVRAQWQKFQAAAKA
ncbi:hypothetical protein KQY30_08865 [Streptomyces sp. GMY02]|uniref:hypothetical protein n=1 Tax=Streptomyces sp. GMY02 TaxID=1333528 RepID=UPI001C2BD817|nr:hypothetical protein [Streptomyces sp. GMY02]QXE34387.1 hypothetical protein KQY30_08865 [Streptomyces sp. GMY02]